MAAIAADAGVAVQTLYLAFGSKVAILEAAHDVAVVGDDEPVALLERPWVADLRADPDGPRALELAIANTLRVIERVSPIYGVIQSAAADPEVAELLARTKAQRLATLQTLAEEFAAKAGFAAGLSADRAADILYAVVSDELYRVLVVERHWSTEDWQTWAYESAALRLFPSRQIHGVAALDRRARRPSLFSSFSTETVSRQALLSNGGAAAAQHGRWSSSYKWPAVGDAFARADEIKRLAFICGPHSSGGGGAAPLSPYDHVVFVGDSRQPRGGGPLCRLP